ncbi:MAG: type III secretion system export apparatus subunit SctT [Pseudomonadota bacterium]
MNAIPEAIQSIYLVTLGMARILAIFSMLPIFGRTVLVGSARIAVALSLSLVLYPHLKAEVDLEALGGLTFALVLFKEILIGVLLGFGFAVLFWAVESMGFFIDNQRGSTMASSVDPLTGSQTSPLGIFMTQVVTVYFLISGAILIMLRVIYESYILFPVPSFFPQLTLTDTSYFLGILDNIVALAVVFAAPAMIAMFLSELALGLISRFAPQLNVFFLAMPVKSAVGIFLLLLYVHLLVEVWEVEFSRLPEHLSTLRGILQ